MKPINYDKTPCNPISSNCVIWQGPDIPCINLCKGDTVSDVVYKLAKELCEILDILNVENYDLDCFGIDACGPENFQDLIQFIIQKICELENISPGQGSGGGTNLTDCPDCLVAVADCFVANGITSMQLTDYVNAIANRVCSIVLELETINAIIENHETRITALENAPDPNLDLPTIVPNCVLPATATSLEVVLAALEQQFCELRTATGLPNEILLAIAQQCANLDALTGSGNLTSTPNWSNSATAAAAINNIWLTICDLRSAVLNIQTNCCPDGCDGIEIAMAANVNGSNLELFFSGVVPAGYVQCSPTLSLTVQDSSSSSSVQQVNVLGNLNSLTPVVIPFSSMPTINSADNLNLSLALCLQDTQSGTQCQSVVQTSIFNSPDCPLVTLTTGLDTVNYGFTYTGGGPVDIIAEIVDALAPTVVLYSNTYPGVVSPQIINDTFGPLGQGVTYQVRLRIQVNGNESICPWQQVTIASPLCTPPISVTSQLILP